MSRRRRKTFVPQHRCAKGSVADVRVEAIADQGKPMIINGYKVVSSTFARAGFSPCQKHIWNIASKWLSAYLMRRFD